MKEIDVVKLLLDERQPDEVKKALKSLGYNISRERDLLQKYLDDEQISEIMINGTESIYIEKKGQIQKLDWCINNEQKIIDLIFLLIGNSNKRLDNEHPMVNARIGAGRLNAIIPPVCINGPVVTIRKFIKHINTIQELLVNGTLGDNMAEFCRKAVLLKQNIIISGGTSTGKTTLINILADFIDDSERIITIEDVAELNLNKSHVISLEVRDANTENKGEITIRNLFANSLRMRPDRIIIGECRGREAFDMLQAMNSGHIGSMTTLHANTPNDAIKRLEFMVSLANDNVDPKLFRSQIVSAIDIVIQLERLKNGKRVVSFIKELTGMEGNNICFKLLYWFDKSSKTFFDTGLKANFES